MNFYLFPSHSRWTMNVRERPDALPDHVPSTWRRKLTTVTTIPKAYWNYGTAIWTLYATCWNIRHRVNISYYRASDAHGTYFNRIVIFYSWIIRHLPCTWITRRGLPVHCWHARHVLLLSANYGYRRLPCIWYARHVLSYPCTTLVHSSWSILTTWSRLLRRNTSTLLVFLWGRNCVVGICCGCPPFFVCCPVPDWTVYER